MVLAGFALVSGLLAYPMGGFGNLVFFGRPEAQVPLVGVSAQVLLLEILSLGVALLGLWLARSIYSTHRIPAERFTSIPGGAFVQRMLAKRYWIDDAYDAFGRTIIYGIARVLDWFDRRVIDGIVNAVGRGGVRIAAGSDAFDRRVIDGAVNAVSLETVRTSWRLRQRQTGQVQNYAWVVVVGIVAVVILLFGMSFLQRFLGGR
jgi:NADH-quinone oxidoreductase subunit L